VKIIERDDTVGLEQPVDQKQIDQHVIEGVGTVHKGEVDGYAP
jgi:hypothetical protein